MKARFTMILTLLILAGCGSNGDDKQKTTSIKTELAILDAEISAAEKTNGEYAGGLVKALITSRIENPQANSHNA